MIETLPAIEIETAPKPDFSVIWLHGLGADGSDFEPIVPELGLPDDARVRFVFPHAPMMPVTCNGGYIMRAWYDIKYLDGSTRDVDEAGVRASCEAVRALIARENALGVPTHRIVLAGFSQGGAIAYTAGLSHPQRLAGVIALSTYLPARQMLLDSLSAASRATPIFAAHGTHDDVVGPALGEAARACLAAEGYPIAWHTYRMAHSVCIEEIAEIGRWLAERLREAAPA
ncbi:dienelactone hydrolase family protein [Niveibacterium sp. 24ML]|uniref:alpha/beta hydrolase n=1 Tax=Niveibacterium sp. 24ML TaxID=2985512 RepID=UPI0022721A65|nr:dienelactone hydrolase family protein [Niveibacterium sp. 24ML]MCX9155975.1 dienelactone hydrolase family protein [Niveibacterium sp. 24ML]